MRAGQSAGRGALGRGAGLRTPKARQAHWPRLPKPVRPVRRGSGGSGGLRRGRLSPLLHRLEDVLVRLVLEGLRQRCSLGGVQLRRSKSGGETGIRRSD